MRVGGYRAKSIVCIMEKWQVKGRGPHEEQGESLSSRELNISNTVVECGTMECSEAWCRTTQYNTLQYSIVQDSAVRCCAVPRLK